MVVSVVPADDLDEYVFGALRARAAGFLLKDAQPEVLINAIHEVANGFGLIAPEVTGRLIGESPRSPRAAKPLTAELFLEEHGHDPREQQSEGAWPVRGSISRGEPSPSRAADAPGSDPVETSGGP